ncbi:toll-like receptor 6 [Saccostrea echinata]|uniref:toll-like receptor 6 n=1 Tax=Saccostrea echinata TaxID=191078 RepID=UPI002A7FA6CD|nr:toll-like receptor 6 [Saccostrea echinata]
MAADRLPLLSNNVCDGMSDSESENEQFTHIPYQDREENLNWSESETSQTLQNDEHSELQVLPLQQDKKYHLFISYSSEDRDDANEICACMEQRFHMKCMNFERDFVPGKNIDDNIADNMRKSVKVLIILSPNYLQSHWCVTEAREAAQLSFTGFSDVNVIPLLLRPLGKDLPPFLKSYVYIDAQREFDVPAKIYEAYLNPGNFFHYFFVCSD